MNKFKRAAAAEELSEAEESAGELHAVIASSIEAAVKIERNFFIVISP